MEKAIFNSEAKVERDKLNISLSEQLKFIELYKSNKITEDNLVNLIEKMSSESLSYELINYCIDNRIGLNYISHLDLIEELLLKLKNVFKYDEVEQTLLFRYYSLKNDGYYSISIIKDDEFTDKIEKFNLSEHIIKWALEELEPFSIRRKELLKDFLINT